MYYNENVSEEEGKEFAKEINAIFINSVSAQNNSGIKELFESVAKATLDNLEKISNRQL